MSMKIGDLEYPKEPIKVTDNLASGGCKVSVFAPISIPERRAETRKMVQAVLDKQHQRIIDAWATGTPLVPFDEPK